MILVLNTALRLLSKSGKTEIVSYSLILLPPIIALAGEQSGAVCLVGAGARKVRS